MRNHHNIFGIYIHLTADTLLKTLSIEGIDSSTSRHRPISPGKVVGQTHISTKEGISSVLVRMDGSGFLHDIKKITLEEKVFTLRNFVIKKQTEECPLKSEGNKNTTCPELTETKLKERLEGKDAAILISEDDGNNSFLQKSEGQDETTENSRYIPEKFHKD